MANNDFILKVFDRFYQNFYFLKNFFPNFKSKVYSQEFSRNELEVDF